MEHERRLQDERMRLRLKGLYPSHRSSTVKQHTVSALRGGQTLAKPWYTLGACALSIVIEDKERIMKMKRTGRLRWSGAIVAAFLALTPLLGMGTVASAQSTSEAKSFLTDAQGLTDGLTPVVDQESLTVTQKKDVTALKTISADPIENFYLEFTVEAPRDGVTDPFDFGLFFRDQGDDYYGLAISSAIGDSGPGWGLVLGQTGSDPSSVDSGDISASDFPTDVGSTYDVVVAAIGNDASFSVNGTAVAMLDISDQSAAGNISLASGFLSSGVVAGDKIAFSNVTLYDLNADSAGTSTEASPTPEDGGTPTGGQTE